MDVSVLDGELAQAHPEAIAPVAKRPLDLPEVRACPNRRHSVKQLQGHMHRKAREVRRSRAVQLVRRPLLAPCTFASAAPSSGLGERQLNPVFPSASHGYQLDMA